MAVKGQENLIPFNKRTEEEQREIARQGGIRSGEVRRENATMRKQLEAMLNKTDEKGELYSDKVSLGLIANAIDKTKGGNPEAYKVIAKMLGELNDEIGSSIGDINNNITNIASLINNPVETRTEDNIDEVQDE